MCRYYINPYRLDSPRWEDVDFASGEMADVIRFHRWLSEYSPTPLVSLAALAETMGVKEILVKDESFRFGLSAFKVMGASYAIYRFMQQEWLSRHGSAFKLLNLIEGRVNKDWINNYTFCTASDGNHGRAVAWTARRFHQQAVIYMPSGTVAARIENIAKEDARVVVVDGNYDAAVGRAAKDAESNGWQVISDTAYSGYMTVPRWIMAGYMTIFSEVDTELDRRIDTDVDIIFLQAGVGSFAAAATWYYVNRYGPNRPKLVIVEPTQADCMMESIRFGEGEIRTSRGSQQTIMAGLNCGIPSLLAWPIIRDGVDLFLTISDSYAIDAMRKFYKPQDRDVQIISGESGASGMAALLALLQNEKLEKAKEKLELGPDSRLLIFNTEGATDPENFKRIVGE